MANQDSKQNEESAHYPKGIDDPVFKMNMEAYKKTPTTFDCLIYNHFNDEISTLEEYKGRELYELIQNADDASASYLKIELKDSRLTVSNDGDKPFTQEGYASIMRSNQSTKRNEKYIGYKGLGFRSVLNWCNSLTINSRIAPRSPEGLACEFSQKIALKNYDNLRKCWGQLDLGVEKIFEDLKSRSKRESPVPILSIPSIKSWKPDENITTQIVLDLFPDIVEQVKKNIEMLNNSQFFLFLQSIKTMILVVDGQETTINWKAESSNNSEFVNVYNSSRSEQKWIIKRIVEDKISVAAARCIDSHTSFEENHNYFFHSFFPTKIKLGYGCVLHATVKLDKSRNHMLSTTTTPRVLELLAKATVDLALSVISFKKTTPTWDGYDVVCSKIDFHPIYPEFDTLNKSLTEARESEPLCPTAFDKYIPLNKSIHIAEEFSKFAEDKKKYNFFNEVLKCGFAEQGIEETYSFLYPQIEAFADPEQNQTLSDEDRVSYISTLARLSYNPKANIGPLKQKLKLLIDQNGCLIADRGLILTGRNDTVPSIIKIKIVKEVIVTMLKNELAQEIKDYDQTEKNPNRNLSGYLAKICNVGYNDFNGVKSQLFSASQKEHTKEEEIELVRYLFNQWKSSNSPNNNMPSDKRFVVPEDEVLYLLDSEKTPREICNLIYGCKDGNWAPYISDWPSELGLTDNEANEIKEFLTRHLHMASTMPLKFIDWAYYDGYLEEFCHEHVYNYRRQLVSDSLPSKRMEFVVDNEFLQAKNFEEVIRMAVSDDILFEIIHPGPKGEYILYYYYRCLHTDLVRMSPCAFSLCDKIDKQLSSYVVNEKKWLGDERLDISVFTTEEYDRFVKLAILMGAKKDDSELTLEEIYEKVNEIPKENHSEKYKEYKDRLKLKGFPENKSVPPLNLWCTMNGELLPDKIASSECYYWDNTPPKAILSNFPLFDIGKREGEILVQKLFGVKPVSSIICTPKNGQENVCPNMTKDVRSIIDERRKYFLAYRCENIRKSESRAEQIKTVFNTISNFKFEICSRLEYEIDKKSYSLDTGEYITDPEKKYWIVLKYQNIQESPVALETISSMLCNILKIEEKNWGLRFKDILRSNPEDLGKRLLSDFDTDYIEEIQNIMEGIDVKPVVPKQRFPFENLNNIIEKIKTFFLLQLYENYSKCIGKQSDFYDEWQKKESEIVKIAQQYYDNKADFSSKRIDIEELLLKAFELKRTDVISLEAEDRPKLLPEYKGWIKETFGGWNYEVQKNRKIYSLLFFSDNLDKMKEIWLQSKDISYETRNIEQTNSESSRIPEIKIASQENLHKPEPATGETTSIRHTKGGNQKGGASSEKTERAEKAEQRVFKYLKEKGFDPIPRSSILDPCVEDIRHYDIEYTDSEGILHYVEVKSTTDGIIHFTEEEYAFASKCDKNYDLFIMFDGEMYSLEKASDSIKRMVTPEQYKVLFKPDNKYHIDI